MKLLLVTTLLAVSFSQPALAEPARPDSIWVVEIGPDILELAWDRSEDAEDGYRLFRNYQDPDGSSGQLATVGHVEQAPEGPIRQRLKVSNPDDVSRWGVVSLRGDNRSDLVFTGWVVFPQQETAVQPSAWGRLKQLL